MAKHMKARSMTWRDLMVAIEAMPEEVLDMDAEVWVYADTDFYEGGHKVYDLIPCDSSEPIGPSNYVSMDIG